MVAARLIKQDNMSAPVENAVVTEENIPAGIEENAAENADGQIAEDEEVTAEEVIEENPEETADEDETIVKD